MDKDALARALEFAENLPSEALLLLACGAEHFVRESFCVANKGKNV
jgi:hypothetical protein